ncbi:helix-turn-helix transcriptional regulator [Antribacter gilvus]|uniref:helix-turn-helix transcriptional regulator n=1 Tax=Antribacter gilvus TaxID=2304675 RepID=UPI000F7B241C|nr:helix-turn-helix domain-containing protein [Antribacter gilvus]
MESDDELLRTREVALLLGVPANTLRWWRYIGEGPEWFRLGPRVVVYRASKVAAWLAEREAEGARPQTA